MMNLDDLEADVLSMQHIDAKNIKFYGGSNGLTAENVKGNILVSNSSLPAGTNECIGAFYDQVKKRIIWFNYNSNGNNGIYQIAVQTGTISALFICNTNSASNIFNFNLNYPIASAALVYRTTGDGDLLYWTDGTNRPMYLNLDTVSSLQPFTSDMVNAAKNAPLNPATCVYGNDAAINTNSLKKKLFRFCYRWVYANGEKSTYSPISKEPLPVDDDNPTIQNDPTKNNKIAVTITAGGEDSTAIELAVQESLGAVWGDFRLVDSFNLTEYAITAGGSFTFDFYNNGLYTAIDPNDTDLYFDWLPDKANALELLNGNVLIYGGITDGYDPMLRSDVDVTITSTNVSVSQDYGFAYKWSGLYRFGLIYFDDRGKTNGVVSFVGDAVDTTDFSVPTNAYSKSAGVVQIPNIETTINHLPPSWAVKYQWVRTQNTVTNKFIYYSTNDYQSDGNYLYFCIQSLLTQKDEDTGFVPSYEFSPGDRVRVLAYYDAVNGFTTFNTQLDFEILGTIERTMNSPASPGTFLKTNRPTSFPSSPYTLKMLIEIYTPSVTASYTKQVFYEFGEKYNITGGYHTGNVQNQTVSLPAITSFTEGDVYYRNREFNTGLFLINIQGIIQDSNYSDFFLSSVNSNGRGWIIDENAKTEYNQVLVRWGGKYQSGTNLNALNRFRPTDFDEVDRTKGDIRRFKTRDRILRVFQDRGVGQYGIYSRFIQNNEGVPELVTTNEIITSNNIQYYQGTLGLGGYPTNLCSSTIADYFNDVVTGREVRLSGDGLTDLGLLYKGQFYLSNLVTPYNKQILRSNGKIAKVMKYWDSFENDAHTVLQAGNLTGGGAYEDYNYSFNESRNAFCSFYDEHPEWALSADDVVYSWVGGQMYKRSSDVSYCQFYGIDYSAYITVVFNQNLLEKKSPLSVTEVASDIWDCPVIYTNVKTYGTQRQQSHLVSANFTILEGDPSSAFFKDEFSRGGWINGDSLKGNWVAIKFRKQNASNLVTLNTISMYYQDSPLTTK